MKIPPGRISLALLFALFISAVDLCGFEFSERSVSPSGQFIIYGTNAGFRGSISALAERTKTDLLAVLKQRDAWKIAIVINLQLRAVNLPEAPASELRFAHTEAGAKLQLDLTLSRKMTPPAIERELARVILTEMIYRNQTGISPGDVYIDPPAWLMDGLLASAQNHNRTSCVALLSMLARIPTLAEFLSLRPETLDSAARQLYCAYSFVLVQTLIDTPGGRPRLGCYIDNLGFASNDPIADLRAAFPEMRDFESAWKSEVAELSASPDPDLMTFSQTDEKLNELLKFDSRDVHHESASIENFSQVRVTFAQRRALQQFSQKLLLFATRANPVLRPVIQDYRQIADQLAVGKTRGTVKRLAELKSLHARLSARMSDIDDYLNWFEAAKLETPSGTFEESAETAAADSPKPKRGDRLSVYLDAMELEF
ncbi:MAG TPA: hypothetical protein VLK27_00310 [Chthoniobacterales bacterium]|nr:hypothetical protein [Chthoniobacterales bacterium]